VVSKAKTSTKIQYSVLSCVNSDWLCKGRASIRTIGKSGRPNRWTRAFVVLFFLPFSSVGLGLGRQLDLNLKKKYKEFLCSSDLQQKVEVIMAAAFR
jgi:hypothetical protein